MAFLKDLSLGINLLGRDISASEALKKLGKNSDNLEAKFKRFGNNAKKAFDGVVIAAGAAAVAIGVDAVKSAVADEKAAATLAKTLQQTTGATEKQTKAVEDYISKTQISTGVLDDDLRPSLARLVRSTGDVSKAQKLQKLALDISAASGKDLGTVSNALAKANDGQLTSLKKLGITLGDQAKNSVEAAKAQKAYEKAVSDADTAAKIYGENSKEHIKKLENVKVKQEALNAVQSKGIDWIGELSKQYAGSLDKQLDTTSGKLALMNAKWDDAKEKMGYALLEGLQPLIDWGTGPEGQKFIEDFIKEFSKGAQAVAKALPEILSSLKSVGKVASGFGINFDSLLNPRFLAAAAAFRLTPGPVQVKAIAAVAAYAASDYLTAASDPNSKLNTMKGGLQNVKLPVKQTAKQANAAAANRWQDYVKATGGGKPAPSAQDNGDSITLYGVKIPKMAKGGVVRKPTLSLIGEAGPEAVVPLSNGGVGGMSVVVNVAGSVIQERDLAVRVRDEIAQMMRRRGLNPASIGV